MAGTNDLANMVPGFEFLQGLFKNASAGLPHIGQWVAPTLDPEELDKRIQELKTVQFWLEQNARLLGTTIQALEVQRMTLSTLQTMNLPLADLGEALKIRRPPEAAAAPFASFATPAPAAPAAPEPDPEPAAPPAPVARKAKPPAPERTAATPPAVDPMKWWGALTQQFTELAAKAVKDAAPERPLPATSKPAAAPAPAPAKKSPARKRAARPR
jgi:hypothetical protein